MIDNKYRTIAMLLSISFSIISPWDFARPRHGTFPRAARRDRVHRNSEKPWESDKRNTGRKLHRRASRNRCKTEVQYSKRDHQQRRTCEWTFLVTTLRGSNRFQNLQLEYRYPEELKRHTYTNHPVPYHNKSLAHRIVWNIRVRL